MSERVILFSAPYLTEDDKSVFLNCDVVIDDKTRTFWFKYDIKFRDFIVTESIESFVLAFLPYCLKKNIDIKSDFPINEVFKYNIQEFLIPTLARNINSYNIIRIDVPTNNIKYGGNGVAVGISCGVDSSYTILKNYNTHSLESGMNINYVTFFNAGSSGSSEKALDLYNKRLEQAKKAADYLKLDLIAVDTNINSIYTDFDYESVHTYRTLAIPLTLQKLLGRYYYSSSFTFENFKFDDSDPTYHDLLTMSCISTPSLNFTVVGCEATRIEKLKFISEFEFPKRFLNVCVRREKNCSKCFKCIRTMLDLFLIGKLEDYSSVFDIDYFYNHFDDFVVYAIENKNGIDMPEIYRGLLEKRIIKRKHFRKVRINAIKRRILKSFIGKICKRNNR